MTRTLLAVVALTVVVAALPASASVLRYAGEARAGGAEVRFGEVELDVGRTHVGHRSGWIDEDRVAPPCQRSQVCATAIGGSLVAGGETLGESRAEANDHDDPGPNEAEPAELPEGSGVSGGLARARAEVEAFPERAEGAAEGAQLSLRAPSDARALVEDSFGEALGEGLAEGLEPLGEDMLLARLSVGSSSSVTLEDDRVTHARATADGGSLTIAPLTELGEDGDGLIVIDVGSSEAGAAADRRDRTTTAAEADAAVARVRVVDPATGEVDETQVAPGDEPLVVAEGTPLETTVHAATATTDHGEHAATATAEPVRIEAFRDPLPRTEIAMGGARTGAGGESEGTPPPPPPDGDVEPAATGELPTTGGVPTAAALALLGAGVAGLGGTRWLRRHADREG